MGVTLGQLARNHATLVIPTSGDEPLRITYRPAAITPRVRAQLQAAEGDQDATLDAMTAFLAAVVEDWTLEYTGPDGTPSGRQIPATAEGLLDVDYEAQAVIINALMEAVQLGEANGARSLTPSASPSSPAATPAISRRPSRTGTRRSK